MISHTIITNVRDFFKTDARHFQIILQFSFLMYGILFLDWHANILNYLQLIVACLLFQALFIILTKQSWNGLKSAFISAMSLSLLLKTNTFEVLWLAAFLSIASKYIFRFKKKHFFNPTNFGILTAVLLTQNAWVSPGQWGNDMILAALILTGGSAILLKVGRFDSSIAFICTYGFLTFWYQVIYLGWDLDVFFHGLFNGTLLLFTFFMITDPKSSPDARKARIIWAVIIGFTAFLLISQFYLYTAPLWALLALSLFTPFFDYIFKSSRFQWNINN